MSSQVGCQLSMRQVVDDMNIEMPRSSQYLKINSVYFF